MARRWANFRLLDPSLGAALPEDRAQVRVSAMQVDAALRWMMHRRAGNPASFRALGLGDSDIEQTLLARVDDCGRMQDWR